MTREECIARLNEIAANSSTYDYCEFEIIVNDWGKNGRSRTYFAIVEKSTSPKISKHYVKKDYGYFDNITNEYITGQKDLTKRFTFSGANF